jgi:hypothetical protein
MSASTPVPTLDLAAPAHAPLPLAHAHRFVERAAGLSEREWGEVFRRAHLQASSARRAATDALSALLVGHPQSRAFGALTRCARDAAEIAERRRVVPAELASRAARLVADAAGALAAGSALAPSHARVLLAPFDPAPADEGPVRDAPVTGLVTARDLGHAPRHASAPDRDVPTSARSA